jgi:prevent-host-death family protein
MDSSGKRPPENVLAPLSRESERTKSGSVFRTNTLDRSESSDQISHMKIVNLSEAKANLSGYVARVRKGARIRIVIRGVPVADVVPVETHLDSESGAKDDRLIELERAGLVRRATRRVPESLFKPGPSLKGKSAVKSLLEERRSGR